MSALATPEEAQAKVQSHEWTVEEWAAWYGEHQQAVADAERAARLAITPHVLRAPKAKPGRMSGPRYFNLMRAIEADPVGYADYLPTTYCGAARTTEDWDKRTALSKAHHAAAVERGVCPDCLRIATEEAAR